MNSQATSVIAWRLYRSAISARLVHSREIGRTAFWERDTHVKIFNCKSRITIQTSIYAGLHRNGRVGLLGPSSRIIASIWRRRSYGKIRCNYRTVQCNR